MTCPVCHENEATRHPSLGICPCESCLARRAKLAGPSTQVEMTTSEIKDQRKAYANSITQPWRSGIASKEFAEAYPERAKQLFKGQKPEYVWKEGTNYQNRKYSK